MSQAVSPALRPRAPTTWSGFCQASRAGLLSSAMYSSRLEGLPYRPSGSSEGAGAGRCVLATRMETSAARTPTRASPTIARDVRRPLMAPPPVPPGPHLPRKHTDLRSRSRDARAGSGRPASGVGCEGRKEDMPAYFDDADLSHFGDLKQHAPELWNAFERYYAAAFEPGLLTKREKVLVGFAVAQVSQCPYCIDSYTQTALEQGLTMKHLAEAMHAAASLRAGIALAHGLVAHNVDKKISM